MRQQKIDLDTITLGPKVQLTDPCYAPSLLQSRQKHILPGTYKCFAYQKDYAPVNSTSPDKRITSLITRHEDSPKAKFSEFLTYCAVDSGQFGFFDADYYEQNFTEDSLAGREDEWYKRVCKITLEAENCCGTIDGRGVVSESGFGDGFYQVYAAMNEAANIVGLKVEFIES